MTGAGRATTVIVVLVDAALVLSLVAAAYGLEGAALPPVLGVWVSLPYVVAGIAIARRPPARRLGRLMIAAGIATLLGFGIWSSDDRVHTLGLAVELLPAALLLHLFLGYPTGALGSARERVIVGAAYAAVALTLPALLVGLGAPRNVIAVWQLPELADALLRIQLSVLSALMLVGIGALLGRRLKEASARNPVFGWAVDAFAIGLLSLALLMTSRLFGWDGLVEPMRLTAFFMIRLGPIVLVIGLLQLRLGRASVGDLIAEMGTRPDPRELEDAASRALRDPSATIAYWVAEISEYADYSGARVELPRHAGRSIAPIERDGATVAVLVHDAALDREPQLVEAVAQAVGMAIENAQLQVELQAQLAEVQASRARIVTAGDAERRRLERDLHDGAQQRLVALSLALRRAEGRLANETDPALAASLADASQLVRDALDELRELARGLHPAVLTETGLAGAVAALAARSAVPVEVLGVPEERLPPEVEAAAYFFVAEALTNVAKHAPTARASVRSERSGDRLLIEVADDGLGGASALAGSGLQGMEDRMAAAGGGFSMSSPLGGGTRVSGWLPLNEDDE